jgi:biotin carboxylase
MDEKWSRTVFLVQDEPARWVPQLVERAHTLGLHAAVVTPQPPGADLSATRDVADEVVVVDTVHDPDVLATAVLKQTGGVLPAAVLTVSDTIMVPVARAAETIGVAKCPAAAIVVARNKFATREAMAAAGLPGPGFGLIGAADQAEAVAEQVGLPAVIKPVNGSGSNLVTVVRTVAELADAYRLLATRLPDHSELYQHPVAGAADGRLIQPDTEFLVEGMLRGEEYLLDFVIRDGEVELLVVFDKPLLDDRFFEQIVTSPPLDYSDELHDRLYRAGRDAVLALGLDNVMAHVEIVDDDRTGMTIVEVNACRPGGAIVTLITELRTGADSFAEVVSLAAGVPAPPRVAPRLPMQLATLTLFSPGSGRLVRIHGLDEVAALPEVLNVITAVSPGDVLDDEHEIYAVNLLAAGFQDKEDLLALYEEAGALVRLELEPVDPA